MGYSIEGGSGESKGMGRSNNGEGGILWIRKCVRRCSDISRRAGDDIVFLKDEESTS